MKEGLEKATDELEQGMLKIDKGNLINDISQGFDTSSSQKSNKRFMCRKKGEPYCIPCFCFSRRACKSIMMVMFGAILALYVIGVLFTTPCPGDYKPTVRGKFRPKL